MKASQIAVGTLPSPLKLRAIGDLAASSVQNEKAEKSQFAKFQICGRISP
jgi:hypothetical protein